MDRETIRKAEKIILNNIVAIREGEYEDRSMDEWQRCSQCPTDI